MALPLKDRFLSHVDQRDQHECWLWTGAQYPNGYGAFGVKRADGKWASTPAHRAAYTLLVDVIPVGLEVDHLCSTRLCCNPAHLEPVTRAENLARRFGDACKYGHSREGNTGVNNRGSKYCRVCQRAAVARHRMKRLA